ncbi:MAG: hypothetical protein H6698_08000 [Myxococcales bacterium]|nr:hypothetical protein [Myxococcales bacterium]MCB9534230.1 hypothetical protein [Myxococcales bacterium]
MPRLTLSALAALAAFALLGCSDDYGETCSLPDSPTIGRFCDSTADGDNGTVATCVFTNSADCSTRMCAQVEGQAAYCTQSCDAASGTGCPADSYCVAIPGQNDGYCVVRTN